MNRWNDPLTTPPRTHGARSAKTNATVRASHAAVALDAAMSALLADPSGTLPATKSAFCAALRAVALAVVPVGPRPSTRVWGAERTAVAAAARLAPVGPTSRWPR